MAGEKYIEMARKLFAKQAMQQKAKEEKLYRQNKERLINLISKAEKAYCKNRSTAESKADFIAEYLIKHNVMALPCDLNDTIYKITYQHCCTNPDWDHYSIAETKLQFNITGEFGKDLFLTKTDAEKEAERRNRELHKKEK